MSEFDIGFGSAAADQIVDQATYDNSNVLTQFQMDQVQKVKTAMNELSLAVSNAISARNDIISQINALPAGSYKDSKIAEFKSVDDGGWFTPSFSTQVQGLQKIADLFGIQQTLPDVQTLGIFGVDDLAEITAGAWLAAVAGLAIITAAVTYFGTQALRYAAILVDPSGVQQADPSIQSILGGQVGQGMKYGIVALSIGGILYFWMKGKK
jgi:hypothetical protein